MRLLGQVGVIAEAAPRHFGALRDHIPGVYVEGAAAARQALVDVGFVVSQWAELATGRRPPGWADDEDPTTQKLGGNIGPPSL